LSTTSGAGPGVVTDFLSDLPSKNPDNFQRWSTDGPKANVTRKPSSYVSTKDVPSQQVIVTEKTNILLRYLHQQFDKKNKSVQQKREGSTTGTEDEDRQRKRARFE